MAKSAMPKRGMPMKGMPMSARAMAQHDKKMERGEKEPPAKKGKR